MISDRIANQLNASPLISEVNQCFSTNALSQSSSLISQTNYCSERKDNKTLPKPDFSSIEKVELTLELKGHGSYKKTKMHFPQTPIKSPLKSYYTPNNCTKQLGFYSKINESRKPLACRKLDFNSNDEDSSMKDSSDPVHLNQFSSQLFACLEDMDEDKMSVCLSKKSSMVDSLKQVSFYNIEGINKMQIEDNSSPSQSPYERSGKFESEFIQIKTFSQTISRNVWKCFSIELKKLVVVKSILQQSNQKKADTIQLFIKEATENRQSCFSNYCSMYFDYWEETESNELSGGFLSPPSCRYVYVLEKYYPNGDLLDFLSQLEKRAFQFSDSFYWDLFFEMLCGLLHFHECGFVHFDVQPGNFFIDSNGNVKLGGFALSKPYKDLLLLFEKNSMLSLDDYFEGDFCYLAPELFNRSTINDIGFKCDVFSLGLSFLEIIGKVHLPQNGVLWQTMREPNFQLHPSFFPNATVNDYSLLKLIQKMINADVNQRPTILDLMNDAVNFPELNRRFRQLFDNSYRKTSMDILIDYLKKDEDEEREFLTRGYDISNMQLMNAKRSNSSKFCFMNLNGQ